MADLDPIYTVLLTMVQVLYLLVGLQYVDKKWSCQPDLVDAQNTDYLA